MRSRKNLISMLAGICLAVFVLGCGRADEPRHRIHFSVMTADREAVPAVQLIDANNKKPIATMDTDGMATYEVFSDGAKELCFTVADIPKEYPVFPPESQPACVPLEGAAYDIEYELFLQPSQLNYVFMIDTDTPYANLSINESVQVKLNSLGSAAFLFRGNIGSTVTLSLGLPQPETTEVPHSGAQLQNSIERSFELTNDSTQRIIVWRASVRFAGSADNTHK